LSIPTASSPSMSRRSDWSPFRVGGVAGSVKLNSPSTSDAMAAILKVSSSCPFCSQASQPMMRPATIQPTVPRTRAAGNCFSGLAIWRKETEFTSAKVGMYRIM
jgi:hypothetical protein